jgi:uncharacterized protein (TIGR03067 family)
MPRTPVSSVAHRSLLLFTAFVFTAFAFAASGPSVFGAEGAAASQDDIAQVQGRWEREEPQGSDASYKRATKEIRGDKETVTYYDADGKIVRQHKVDFKLSRTGDVNVFTYTNWEATEGPQKGTKMPGSASYIYRVGEKQFREVWGFLPGQETRRTVLNIWKKSEADRDAAAALAAEKPDGKGDEKGGVVDAKALAGTWEPTMNQRGGNVEPEEQTKRHRLVFEGDKFQILRDGNALIAGTYKVDNEAKPARIDMLVEESENAEDNGRTVLGIIEVTGDGMKWCTGGPRSSVRPTEFASEDGSRDMFVVLRREKPKKAE